MPIESKVISYTKSDAPVHLSTIELPDEILPDEILVKTSYIALNPADLKVKTMAFYTSQWYAGLECSGIVEKCGANAASRFKPGDKVCVLLNKGRHNRVKVGSFTKVDITKSGVMHQPKVLDDVEAGGFTLSFATAWKLIASGQVDPDLPVLILGGATCVGSLLIQLLKKHYKVKRVVATCSPKSESEVKSYGADETINYRAPNYAELLKQSAAKGKYLTVYDCVGGYDAISISNDLLLPVNLGSLYVTLDGDLVPTKQYTQTKLTDYLFCGARMAFRYFFGPYYGLRYKFILTDAEVWPMLAPEIIDASQIHLKIAKVFPASEVAQAWDAVDHGHGGKVVLKF